MKMYQEIDNPELMLRNLAIDFLSMENIDIDVDYEFLAEGLIIYKETEIHEYDDGWNPSYETRLKEELGVTDPRVRIEVKSLISMFDLWLEEKNYEVRI